MSSSSTRTKALALASITALGVVSFLLYQYWSKSPKVAEPVTGRLTRDSTPKKQQPIVAEDADESDDEEEEGESEDEEGSESNGEEDEEEDEANFDADNELSVEETLEKALEQAVAEQKKKYCFVALFSLAFAHIVLHLGKRMK
jgi:hypothetical protein